jgi:hypothetical protein
MLARANVPHAEMAVELLTWSTSPRVAPLLRAWAVQRVPMDRRALKRKLATPPTRRTVTPDVPYRAILRALRGHPSPETESFLLLAARDWDPTFRIAALGSLGWWEPFDRGQVLEGLIYARCDICTEVRLMARAALARLGERHALQWFRHALSSEEPAAVHEAIQLTASEGLTLLWPDLDQLADREDIEIAHHAREALERMCEDMDRRNGRF